MKNNFFRKWFVLSALFAFMCFSPHVLLRAQSTANYAFTTNTSGSLGLDMNGNVVDMSTGTTQVLATNTSQDQVINAAAIAFPAGFEFYLGGSRFTSYFATSNGIVQLGSTAVIGGGTYTAGGGTLAAPRITAFNGDLGTGTTGGIFGKLIGSAPNRCYVIEFRNMSLMWTSAYPNNGTYQVRFYESTGVVEYVYGTMVCGSTASAGDATPEVGFSWGGSVNQSASINISTSAVDLSGVMVQNTIAAGNITNLNSAAEGSRRVYRFTPPAPAAPSGLSFSSVGTSYMSLNWTDNASNEVGYAIYRSLDGVNYTYVSTIPANSSTYTGTGLSGNTLYYWNVYAVSEGVLSSPVLSGNQSTIPCAAISGIKTVGLGGDYPNLSFAFADINGCSLAGNTELQLIAGYPAVAESYPITGPATTPMGAFTLKVYPMVSGLSITSANASGTLNLNNSFNVTIDGRVNQAGANDLVISNTGTGYAVQFVNDAKSNVLQYLTIQSSNTSTSSGTIVFAGSTGTTGNDNNLIDYCDIKDGAATPLNGIYSAGTSTTIDNSGNVVSNSNIYNYFGAASASNGILLSSNSSGWTINGNKFYQTGTRTSTSGNTHRAINIITSSGNGYVITNNVIGYASSAATGVTTYAGAFANRFTGIELTAATTGTASSIQGNTVTGISLSTTSGATAAPGILAGISVLGGTVSVGNVTPNIIGGATGTGAIAVTTSTSANVFGIHATSTGTLIVSNNTVGSINAAGSAAGVSCGIVGINTAGASTATTVSGNTIGSTTANSIASGTAGVTTAATTISGIATAGASASLTVSGNTINNLTNYSSSTTAALNGIISSGSPVSAVISNNMVSNTSLVSGTLTNISTASPTTLTVSGNTLFNASGSGATATINGISTSGATTGLIFKNKIYNLNAAGATSAVNGILASGGAAVNIYNNVIGDLKTPTTSATDPVRGISITSTSATTVYRVYYNSIYLNASSSGANFGTTGVYHTVNATATTAALDMRNNIIINESTPAGTGITVAFRRSGIALGNFASTSNRNLLYAGIPSATNLLMYDGTNPYQTIIAYQTAVAPREINSFTGEVAFTGSGYGAAGNFFMSTTPSSANYLKPVAAITTQVESGAVNITTPSITDDYASVVRQGNAGYTGTGTSPDLGAFEFEGTTPAPVIVLNSVTPPASAQCAATARLVSADITTASGTIAGANLTYAVNGTPQTPIAMTNVSGSTWTGTIPVPTPANATITWGVVATNSLGINGSYVGTAYADEPLFGVATSVTASSPTICAASSSVLTAELTKSGSVTIGTATTLTGATSQPTAFCNRWPSYRMQTIFTAAELNAAGLRAGPITSMSYNITTLGDGATNANFVVKIGTTGLTAFTDFVSSAGYTTVYPAATYTHAVGVNVINFSTPYNWDGTSNIVVEVSHDGADLTNNSQTYYTATPGNTVVWSTSGNAVGTTSTNRLNVVFTGNVTQAIQAISWSDGVGTVGTTNPLSVSPTTTTSYTATITAAGCAVTPAPTVTVNVNPLPATPTAANSAQCGTQVPTASVTSTSGLPTPTFKWYDAAVAGTVLQSSTSTTYTTAISVTTTFYVSELNTVTGCESARVPVTVTVSTPDAISASASVAAVCENGSVTLTAANTNPTPLQTYTYSWASAAGSGAETPVAGNPVTINPTVAGTYIYTATAVDGGCTTTNTVSVTVNPNPASVAASVSDASICNGDMVNLSVTSITGSPIAPVTIMAQNFDAGLGTWATTYSGTAPAASGWFGQNAPFSYTTYFTNFATPQGGGFAMTNGDIGGSGLKTRATLISPAFSTVGMTSATLTFQNLYQKWNSGDSLVRLEISADGGTSWATLKDYLPLGSQGVVTSGAQVPANESIVLGAPYLNQANLKIRYNYVTAWGYYWVIDDVKVTGVPVDPSTYSWTSAPAGFTSSAQNPTGVAPAVNTNYTVTITNSFGCSASGSVAVTVNQPSSSTVTASSCDSYTWAQNGTTYTASGAYTAVIPNAAGCDSTITLNLTINNSTTATVSVTNCSTYTWPINGQTYTASGAYTATISNAVGCDSVITLNLTINTPTSATVNHTACQTYTWPINGQTYTTSGTYTATIANAAGCDSVITLNLTIGGPSASSVTVTECSSYTWAQNGMTYTASGAYTDTVVNMFGCDSVITLNLTINQPTTSTVTETECTSYTWAQNGMTYTASGMYNDTIANAVGCDSIIILDLTIIQPTTSTVTVTECASYTWAQNGMTYTTSGMYTDTIPNSVGCDSVITLNLTINMPTSSVFTVSTCSPTYTWAQNGTVYNASGMYNDTISNAAGCDSVVTLNLTITNFVATATDNGNATITASAGTTYQWINCTTNTPIAGAIAQTFAATANGTYAVIVSNGTCSDTSNCVNITNVGIKENMISTISVHPNPTNDVVIVTMDASSAIVEVMDVQGKLVQTTQIKPGDQVDLSTYERGVYTLRIKTELGTSIERIVKN